MTRAEVDEVAPPHAAPPRRPRRSRLAVVASVTGVLIAMAVAVLLSSGLVGGAVGADRVRLEVWDQRGERSLHAVDVDLGSRFTLEHTHSVTGRLVVETFSVQEGPIVAIEELWFDEPGPNLPSGSEPLGDTRTTFLHEGRAFRVLHHSYPIGSVPLLVGSAEVDHVLNLADGERIRLLDVAGRGTAVELRVR